MEWSWVKEYAAIVAATIAAATSVATLLLNTRLTLNKEKRKALWDKELEKMKNLTFSWSRRRETPLALRGSVRARRGSAKR